MKIRISVPATSANIGSGYDTMGLALDLYNEFEFETLKSREFVFEGIDKAFWEDNLIVSSVRAVYEAAGEDPDTMPGLKIRERVNVPIGIGLGSSANCIAAGVVLGNLLLGSPFSEHELRSLATAIEGHPDNVIPALTGGLTTSVVTENKNVYTIVKDIHKKYTFCVCYPDFELSTKESRSHLPKAYALPDVVASLSRASMTFLCLSEGRSKLLKEIFGDVLHEPYRKLIIPDYDDIVAAGKKRGSLISYLSGAGPAIMFVIDKETTDPERFKREMSDWLEQNTPRWKLLLLNASRSGLKVSR